MCNLCGTPEERASERRNLEYQATRLELMATLLRSMANGVLKPHSEGAQQLESEARQCVKILSEYL